jgi:hypothetical protein
MNVRPFFVATAQSAKLIHPGKTPFNYPAPSAQSTAMIGVTHREERHDAAGTQSLPD